MKRYFIVFLMLIVSTPVCADIGDLGGNNPRLRLRVGDNGFGGVDRVIFNVPGLDLGTSTEVISSNAISGASGVYTVRFVLDNRRPPNGTARLNANSSSNMQCITATSCGTASIPFTQISWQNRDGNNMELASSYNGGTNQLVHQQTVTATSPPPPRNGWRYRDYIQFRYANDVFLPAGTYVGQVTFTGTHP